ncbi:hypothetical protein RCL1_009105 [Eukaryota sp. TZLM3-RCL]
MVCKSLSSYTRIAGTLKSKLSKKMVLDSSIPQCVQEIMDSEDLNLRISAVLLIGLAVMHEKKTSYVYADVNEILVRVKKSFSTTPVKSRKKDSNVTKPIESGFSEVPPDFEELLRDTELPLQSILQISPHSLPSPSPRVTSRVLAPESVSPLRSSNFFAPNMDIDLIDGIPGFIDLDIPSLQMMDFQDLPELNEIGHFPTETLIPERPQAHNPLTSERRPGVKRRCFEGVIELSNETLKAWINGEVKPRPVKKVKKTPPEIIPTRDIPVRLREFFIKGWEKLIKVRLAVELPDEDQLEGNQVEQLQNFEPLPPNDFELFEMPDNVESMLRQSGSSLEHNATPVSHLGTPSTVQSTPRGRPSSRVLPINDFSFDNMGSFEMDIPLELADLPSDVIISSNDDSDLVQRVNQLGTSFSSLSKNNSRSQVARMFAQVLISASRSSLAIQQSRPYADITLFRL